MSASQRIAATQPVLAAVVLLCALVLGGGQGWLGDSIVQLLALLLIAACLVRQFDAPDPRWSRHAWLVLLPLSVPLLQLLPLPEAVWSWPAGRERIATELATAGAGPPAMRWSLVPVATERALYWLLPAVAMFLATMQLATRARAFLVGLVLAVAAGSVLLGVAQMAGGLESPLRFYQITNTTVAVGFFANRNHFASFLAAALPLLILSLVAWYRRRDEAGASTWPGLVAGAAAIALLIFGLAIARSRTGLGLGMLAVLLSLPLAFKLGARRRGVAGVLAVGLLVGLVLSVQFALFGVMRLMQADPLEDDRFRVADITLSVAREHLPLGTGLGGFRAAYETAETLPNSPLYVNHAHNDYAEIWLEAGLPGAIPVAIALVLFLHAGYRAWRALSRTRAGADRTLRVAAWLSLLMVVLHSIVDYPLRTTAMLAVAGLLAALILPTRNGTPSNA